MVSTGWQPMGGDTGYDHWPLCTSIVTCRWHPCLAGHPCREDQSSSSLRGCSAAHLHKRPNMKPARATKLDVDGLQQTQCHNATDVDGLQQTQCHNATDVDGLQQTQCHNATEDVHILRCAHGAHGSPSVPKMPCCDMLGTGRGQHPPYFSHR
jgi:hypothetical protein